MGCFGIPRNPQPGTNPARSEQLHTQQPSASTSPAVPRPHRSPPRLPSLARAAARLPAARLCLSGKQLLPSGCRQGRGLGTAEQTGRAGPAAPGARGAGCFGTEAAIKVTSRSTGALGQAAALPAEPAGTGCSALPALGGGCCSAHSCHAPVRFPDSRKYQHLARAQQGLLLCHRGREGGRRDGETMGCSGPEHPHS